MVNVQAMVAWELLEVVTETFPLNADQIGFIIGKKGQQVALLSLLG